MSSHSSTLLLLLIDISHLFGWFHLSIETELPFHQWKQVQSVYSFYLATVGLTVLSTTCRNIALNKYNSGPGSLVCWGLGWEVTPEWTKHGMCSSRRGKVSQHLQSTSEVPLIKVQNPNMLTMGPVMNRRPIQRRTLPSPIGSPSPWPQKGKNVYEE